MATLIHVLLLPLPLALLAAVLHLDRSVLFQSLFHRPLFLAPLLGWISGDLNQGIQVALVCEFVSILIPPTGTDLPPDEGGWAAIIMLSLVMLEIPSRAILPLVMCLSLVALPLLRNIEVLVRQGNERLARYAEKELLSGHPVPFKRLVFASILAQVMLYSIFYISGALVVSSLVAILWYSLGQAQVVVDGMALVIVLLIPVAGVLRAAERFPFGLRYGLAAVAAVAGLLLGGLVAL